MSAQDDDVGSTAWWRDVKRAKKEKRAENTDRSTEILVIAGIPFVSKNNGAHLIVDGRYDFWPSTGLWMERDGRGAKRKKHRGIRSLIARIKPAAIDRASEGER